MEQEGDIFLFRERPRVTAQDHPDSWPAVKDFQSHFDALSNALPLELHERECREAQRRPVPAARAHRLHLGHKTKK